MVLGRSLLLLCKQTGTLVLTGDGVSQAIIIIIQGKDTIHLLRIAFGP